MNEVSNGQSPYTEYRRAVQVKNYAMAAEILITYGGFTHTQSCAISILEIIEKTGKPPVSGVGSDSYPRAIARLSEPTEQKQSNAPSTAFPSRK